MACDVLEKTDYDADTFNMDFTSKLPSGVTLAVTAPTVTFLLEDESTPPAGTAPTASNFVLDTTAKIWQFDVAGGTLGVNYIVRVQATRSDGLQIEGNGILQIRIPCP